MPPILHQDQPSPNRLEAFSDGVIAVIITIMVLDFKVPHEPGPAAFARAILPTLAVYLLSFTFTGIYWINHHHIVHRCRKVDAPILYGNLFFLFCLSLLPFATSYSLEKHFDSFSVAIYASALLLSGIGFTVLSLAIARHVRRHAEAQSDLEAAIQDAERRKALLSLALYSLAIPLAYWHPLIALADICLVTLIWILPGFLLKSAHENCGTIPAI